MNDSFKIDINLKKRNMPLLGGQSDNREYDATSWFRRLCTWFLHNDQLHHCNIVMKIMSAV